MEVQIENWAEKRFAINELSSRIPKAIAKAEGMLGKQVFDVGDIKGIEMEIVSNGVTANQVALAKALWKAWGVDVEMAEAMDWVPYPALREFTEIVESL